MILEATLYELFLKPERHCKSVPDQTALPLEDSAIQTFFKKKEEKKT